MPEQAISANTEPISEARARSLANLRPFQPGQSGNPSGRPKKHLTDAMRRKLDNDPERAERIAEQMLTQAEAGDVQSFDRVRDSIEGKPAQSVNINGDIDFSITDRRSRLTEAISSLRDPEQ